MGQTHFAFGRRLRAAFLGGGAAFLLATAAGVAPVLAADPPATTAQAPATLSPHTHQIHGTVKATPAAGATTFTVTTERFGDVTVSFAGATIKGHGHGRARSFEVASAAALKAGDRVVVRGETSADGKTFIARRVHVLPAKGAAVHTTHLVGTIVSTASATAGTTTLTLNPAEGGASRTVTLTSTTRIRPEGKTVADLTAGTKVTVISRNGTATGVVIMPI